MHKDEKVNKLLTPGALPLTGNWKLARNFKYFCENFNEVSSTFINLPPAKLVILIPLNKLMAPYCKYFVCR